MSNSSIMNRASRPPRLRRSHSSAAACALASCSSAPRLAILGHRRAPAVRSAAYHPAAPALLTYAFPNAQLDGIEFGNPVMMDRQKWAMDMAKDRTLLPVGALEVGIYSSHPDDSNGFTSKGNDALIAQDDALRAAVAYR